MARNLAASRSTGEILVFLDDDNLFVDEGLSRLLAAFDNPDVDLVAPTLAIHDHPAGQGRPMGDLVFMGFMGWAGLLFNGFGDANFAIRRARFEEIGGFADDDGAAFDWIFFAKAQARNLEIGVLQKPAIGYRRDLAARDKKWRKMDLEEPRRRVLCAYGVDPSLRLVLGLAQALTVDITQP
jgi:glycosyltransferase involved in cell wall biosynthesis